MHNIEKTGKRLPLAATDSGPKPGDFPIGSPQSRAAARMSLEAQGEPLMKVTIRHVGSNTQLGPWKKYPGGTWIREELREDEGELDLKIIKVGEPR